MNQVHGDPEGVARAERELERSQAAYERTEPTRIALRELRQRNNVTALARQLRSGGDSRR